MAAVVVYGIIVIVVLGIILSLFAYVRVPNDKMAFISGYKENGQWTACILCESI